MWSIRRVLDGEGPPGGGADRQTRSVIEKGVLMHVWNQRGASRYTRVVVKCYTVVRCSVGRGNILYGQSCTKLDYDVGGVHMSSWLQARGVN